MSSRHWSDQFDDRNPGSERFRNRNARLDSTSRSPSPDVDLKRFLEQQARPSSPNSEAYRKQRIAAGGINQSKSRVQREREEAEKRRKEEEESAAKAYDEFVKDMEGGERKRRDKGDRYRYNNENQANFVRAGGSSYHPDKMTQRNDEQIEPRSTSDKKRLETYEMFNDEEGIYNAESSRMMEKDVPPKRKGAMQDFLGELQREQASREERLKSKVSEKESISVLLAKESQKNGPREVYDPNSTNICILNLPESVSEFSLGEYFSYYGDIASVKIMWPRMEDVRLKTMSNGMTVRETRHEGATGFINFMDKSAAENAFREIEGSQWKGCSLRTGWGKSLPRPFEPMFVKSNRSRSEFESEKSKGNHNDQKNYTKARSKRMRSPNSTPHRRQRPRIGSPIHEQSAFDDEGYASFYSTDSEEESENERLQKRVDDFGKVANAKLDSLLRSLTLRRERIARIMLFAIEHAHCAQAISDRIIDSILITSTPLPRKLARLYVISDILHNCSTSASSAWKYRSLFEFGLTSVFLHWGDIANSFQGRIKREACKEMAKQLLDVWESWMIFNLKQIQRWRDCLENGSVDRNRPLGEKESHSIKLESGMREREQMDLLDDEMISEPIVEDEEECIDGEDIDGEDIDGEDIDGEDIDGEAIS